MKLMALKKEIVFEYGNAKILHAGDYPQYECDDDNIAFFYLALSVGFKKYGASYYMK